MQTITDSFDTHSKQKTRRPTFQVLMDWDIDGVYDDESANILSFEGERSLSEPLQGIHQAQMDILLSNVTKRYSPTNSDSPIRNLLRINRRLDLLTGFNDEDIHFGKGISEVPEIDELAQTAKIHFWDELELLQKYKLTQGSELFTDIRTDLYLWEILDTVYEPYFFVIASFDTDETWVGGTIDTTNMRGGDGAMRLDSVAGSLDTAYKDVTWNFGFHAVWDDTTYSWDSGLAWWDSSTVNFPELTYDYVALFVYVEDITKIETLKVRLHKVVDTEYADLDLSTEDLVNGWNQIWVPRENFVSISSSFPPSMWFTIGVSDIEGSDVIGGGFFNFSEILRVEVLYEAPVGQTAFVIFDEIRFVDSVNYPRRFFDIGLADIPVASFSGNTALFEIKTACEAEGARFYADELGRLHFENRQFYNNNDEFKVSQLSLDFNRIIHFEHPKNEQDVINSVKVIINPRVIQSTKEIWRYGEIPSIDPAETITVWASFVDPVPTTLTGLITPVATTDYLGNDDAGGGGADRTADVSIVITKFTTAAKLEITNTGGSALYLTLLKLRGTPAEQQGEVNVFVSDQDSIDQFGEQLYEVNNKYLASSDFAQTLGQTLIDQYKDPIDRAEIEHPALPQLQIGDMISVTNGYTGTEKLMRIMAIALSRGNNQLFKQKTRLRSISPFETLTFFEIGTSFIESTDVIAA